MSSQNFINKLRYWDNQVARWLMRHVYYMFFQFILVFIFITWFVNTLNVIDTTTTITHDSSILERILSTQSVSLTVLVLLSLLNSFWMLYLLNGIQRISGNLRDMNYQLSKIRFREKK